MNGNGHWKKLPGAAILVPAGEAIATVPALSIQSLAAMPIARLTATATSIFALHFM